MRRAVARGRVFPQSYSTDRRYGRLSLKAVGLFPLMWANADDRGRLSGDPEEIKYAVCPNIDHITKSDVPELLKELEHNSLIKVYDTPRSAAVQILDWWEVNQKMQWAWPSEYPPPDGWQDRLRYKKGATEVVTQDWGSQVSAQVDSQVSTNNSSGEGSGETPRISPLTTPSTENEKGTRRGKGKRKRNSPGNSGEKLSSPSPSSSTTDILERLTTCYRIEWGRVPANDLTKIIPREVDAKILAQLRDLAQELSVISCPLDYINQAFKEAASHQKMHISYARKILLHWLGAGRDPPR